MSDAKITLSAEDKTRAAFAGVKANLLGLQQSAVNINQAFGTTAAVLGSAFAGLSLTAFVKATADGLDRLNDIKDATGASIETISALEDVAARTGTTIDTVTSSLVKFNSALNDSKPGSDNDRVFRALGLDVAELKKLDPAEALRQTAVALSKFSDDGDKARAVQQLFGKSLREVAPYLNDLATAGELNAKVTAQQAEEAEKFNKQLAALAKNSVDFARAIVGDVLPGLNSFLEKLQAINRSGGFFTSMAKELRAGMVGEELRRVVADIESIQATINRQGSDSHLERRLRNLRAEAASLTKEGADLSEWLKKFAAQADPSDPTRQRQEDRGFVPGRPGLVVPELARLGGKPKEADIDPGPIGEALQAALKLVEQTDALKLDGLRNVLAELADLAATGIYGPAVQQAIVGLAAEINKLDPEYRQAIADQKRLNELLEATPTQKLEKQRETMQFLARAYAEGRLGVVGSAEAIQAWGEGSRAVLGTAVADVKQATDDMDEFAKEAARNIHGALGTTLKSTLRGDFDSIGQLWGNLLLDMAAEATAAQLGKLLLGDYAKTGSIGGWVGSGLSWLSGIGRVDGGPVGARSVQRVNERGFEVFTDVGGNDWLMTGVHGGKVTPSNKVAMSSPAAGQAPMVFHQAFTFGAGVSRNEMMAYGEFFQAKTMAAVADAQRRNYALGAA